MIAIRSSAFHIPDQRLPVARLPELAELDDGQRSTCLALGVDRVPCDDRLDAVELAARATAAALASAGIGGQQVDGLLLVESRVPATFMASEVTRLQAMTGMDRAVAFSVGGLGCASIGPALLAARGLLLADRELSNVVVAHGCKPATGRRYRHPVTVGGDAGLGLVVARSGRVRIVDAVQETNGAYWDLFQVEYRDRPAAAWREACADVPAYAVRLALETRVRLRGLRDRLLARHGLSPASVACAIVQNLSLGSFRFCEEALGIPVAPACERNLASCGHLGPIDLLLNLSAAVADGTLADGQRAVLAGISPVAAWSLLLVEVGGADAPEAELL